MPAKTVQIRAIAIPDSPSDALYSCAMNMTETAKYRTFPYRQMVRPSGTSRFVDVWLKLSFSWRASSAEGSVAKPLRVPKARMTGSLRADRTNVKGDPDRFQIITVFMMSTTVAQT